MQNSIQWWETTKNNPHLLNQWLIKQYYGELKAAERILEMAYESPKQYQPILMEIAKQESQHADWILGLCNFRNIELKEHDTEKKILG